MSGQFRFGGGKGDGREMGRLKVGSYLRLLWRGEDTD